MKHLRLLTALLALAWAAAATLRAEPPFETMKRQTVSIFHVIQVAGKTDPIVSSGSGFFVGDGRHVVTNHHVCCGAAPNGSRQTGAALLIRISLEKEGLVPAKVIWSSAIKDLAVLELEKDIGRPPAELAPTSATRDAEKVYAMGFPGAARALTDASSTLVVKITEGIISAFVRGNAQLMDADLYQTSAAINPGNSGGPLFDECGRVVGVNVARASAGEGIGWAIRVDELLPVMEELKIPVKVASSACSAAGGWSWGQSLLVLLLVASGGVAVSRRGRNLLAGALASATGALASAKRGRSNSRSAPSRLQRPVLRGVAGFYAGASIELGDEPWTLGRDPGIANLVFPDENKGISRRHCVVGYDRQRAVFLVEDTWSTNGTFLSDGTRIESGSTRELRPGERFYVSDEGNLFEVSMERA